MRDIPERCTRGKLTLRSRVNTHTIRSDEGGRMLSLLSCVQTHKKRRTTPTNTPKSYKPYKDT
jgi:hypothetical protein